MSVSLEPAAALSSLHSQTARAYLSDSLAAPQTIAPLPRVCAQLAELTAQQGTDAAQLAKLIQSDPALGRRDHAGGEFARAAAARADRVAAAGGVLARRRRSAQHRHGGDAARRSVHRARSRAGVRGTVARGLAGGAVGQGNRARTAQARGERLPGRADASNRRRARAEDSLALRGGAAHGHGCAHLRRTRDRSSSPRSGAC